MVEPNEMKTIILCRSGDDQDDTVVYGPFEDEAWANGWLEQHNHVIDGTEEEMDERMADEDHFCINSGYDHWVTKMWVPGFDPTTLPKAAPDAKT